MMAEEVRGVASLSHFSQNLITPCAKLYPNDNTAFPPSLEDADAISVERLVNILSVAAKEEMSVKHEEPLEIGDTVMEQIPLQNSDQPTPPSQKDAQNKCILCQSPATKRCSRCRSVFYCTQQHQRDHWPEHKKTCEKRGREGESGVEASKKLKTEDLFPKLQSLLMSPDGIKRLLLHPSIIALRDPNSTSSSNEVRALLNHLESGNLIGALMCLGNSDVKERLLKVAPQVLEDLGV
jgi:hypothetical protein